MLLAMSWILLILYLAAPLMNGVWSVLAWRRENRRKPLFGLIATMLVCFSIAIGLSAGMALATGAAVLGGLSFAEILIGGYFITGVVLCLRCFDEQVRNGLTRLVKGRKWYVVLLAALTRVAVMSTLVIPWVMGVGMVFRLKIGAQPWPPGWVGSSVHFSAADGTNLQGYYFPADGSSDKTVIVAHGLGATGLMQVTIARDLRRDGWNVFAFDFRAHGNSGGHVSTFGLREHADVLAAVAYLKSHRPQEATRITAVGASMGGAALVSAAAATSDIDALAVVGSYSDLDRLTDEVSFSFFRWPMSWAAKYIAVPVASLHAGVDIREFRPVESVAKLWPRPLMVIHGSKDEMIPFNHGLRLYDAAGPGRRRLWIDGTHNSVIDDGRTSRGLQEFFDRAQNVPEI